MSTIKCLIVDDEPLAIKVIENYLQRLSEFEIVAKCESAIDAFNVLQNEKVDLMFLDINMPMLTGIDFVKSLEKKPEVILTTAYREYALEGFEISALDYLLKPISFQRFLKAANKASQLINTKEAANSKTQPKAPQAVVSSGTSSNSEEPPYIFLKVEKKMVKVALEDIIYMESLKDYLRVYTSNGEMVVHYTLTKILENLPEDEFIRIHRSYAISLKKVNAIEGNQVELKNGKMLPIGRLYQQIVKDTIYSKGIMPNS
ncbi:LytR/AlgR family response regulator transcription factor [Flammeovirga kamogawensis]|uniref:LytTR family DNA-binding domain-containing protein n=1 Tax=Flammeovirga kamogawensis TaxID=373891 RepID=A0ABX8GS41_9BACT|nr:LytTR family DNA-binding domain-containing protein [Flammeovirga kamogawensis]MBB6461431.1 DNA-binding LytR/AlgR family response regulator [Flammeovirga kamogawensis]QWG06326.1 LytTR family DNA-binding domain-containing protein [Flammeovirga kamogawensis]TRX68154.1 response regulator transcription factor [Flammeovirga kamogawensis]